MTDSNRRHPACKFVALRGKNRARALGAILENAFEAKDGDLLAAHLTEFWQESDEREGQHSAEAWHRGRDRFELTALSYTVALIHVV